MLNLYRNRNLMFDFQPISVLMTMQSLAPEMAIISHRQFPLPILSNTKQWSALNILHYLSFKSEVHWSLATCIDKYFLV